MEYSISQVYKDVEQILKRTLNSLDFNTINSLIQNYDIGYIQWALAILKTHNVFSTNYIRNFLFNNYQTYQISKQVFATSVETTQPIIQEQPKQEEQKKEYINDWDEHDEETKAYWLAKLRYAFCPDEYPNPDL